MGFEALTGNEKIVRRLKGYILNNHVPQSLIFNGPPSADCTGFARSFAKAVNCTVNTEGDFCGECESCREISKDIFPDLITIRPEGQMYKKEQIVFLVEDNKKMPLKGRRKVYIVQGADRMNESSANSFLKVLEEPTMNSMFILETFNLNGFLPTILSRCQVLNFSPPTKKAIKDKLVAEGHSEQDADIISYLSGSGNFIPESGDYSIICDLRQEVFEILKSLVSGRNVAAVMENLNSRTSSRDKFISFFRDLVNLISLFMRDIIVLKENGDLNLVINRDYGNDLGNLAGFGDTQLWLSRIEKMEKLQKEIGRNMNAKVLLMEFIRSFG